MTDDPIEQTWRPEVKALRAERDANLKDYLIAANERDALRATLAESEAENDQWQVKVAEQWAEIERLRAQHDNDMHTIDVGSRANAGLEIEHEIQRQMLERLGIEWTPGEPFYSLIHAEIELLRATLAAHIEVIARVHANGYSHHNPWQDCTAPTCAAARDLREPQPDA